MTLSTDQSETIAEALQLASQHLAAGNFAALANALDLALMVARNPIGHAPAREAETASAPGQALVRFIHDSHLIRARCAECPDHPAFTVWHPSAIDQLSAWLDRRGAHGDVPAPAPVVVGIHPQRIIAAVLAEYSHFGVDRSSILAHTRLGHVVEARHLAAWLLHHHGRISKSGVARVLKRKSNCVLNSIRQTENFRQSDPAFRARMDRVLLSLNITAL